MQLKFKILILKIIIYFYKLLGLAPISIKIVPKVDKNDLQWSVNCSSSFFGSLYSLIFTVYCIFITYYYIPQMLEFHTSSISLGIYESILATVGNSIIVTNVLIFNYKQKKMVKIIQKISDFETQLQQKISCSYYQTKWDEFHGVLLTSLPVLIIISDIIYKMITSDHTMCHFVLFLTPALSFGSFLTQYSLILIYLKKRFATINGLFAAAKTLENDVDDQLTVVNNAQNNLLLKHFTTLRQLRRFLFEITYDISRFYSFSSFIVITYYSGALTYIWYSFIRILMSFVDIKYISTSLYLLNVLPLIIFTNIVTQTTREMMSTGSVVHAAMVKYQLHDRISYELQQFSIELLHQDDFFTGFGVFPLNNSVIMTIFSVVMLRTMVCVD